MKSVIRTNRQAGQAIVWFLVTLAACCAMFAVVYNVGQVTSEKEKTVNAADASALSGALVEARILNFEAYTNRAMIANEVTIAQLVSADSWVSYDATMAQYLDDYLQVLAVIPIVGTAIVSALDGYSEAMQYAQQVTQTIVQTAIPACDLAITVLKGAREGAYSLGSIAANSVASGIANANETTFGGRIDSQPQLNPAFEAFFLVQNTQAWLDFQKPYGDDDRTNAKAVILASRDQFSTQRGAGPLIDTINTLLEAGGLISSGGTSYYGFDKTSTQTVLQGFDHWAAQDSLDPFQASLSFCGLFHPLCYQKTYLPVPLAYGRADAGTDGGVSDSTGKDLCHLNGFSLLGLAGTTTNCELAAENSDAMSSNGIPNIRDLAKPGGPNTPDPTLTFVAGVQRAGSGAITTQNIGSPGMNTVQVPGPLGSPDVKDNMQNGGQLTSIAFAKVFFLRPDWNTKDITEANLPRPDHVHEYASLYNPYWQARLTQADDSTRQTFYTIIGLDSKLSADTP
jgi:hypothetical protein